MAAKSLPNAAKRDVTASRASESRECAPGLEFPRAYRLLHRADFDAVYREGRKRTSRELAVFLRANGLPHSRFGWSIKKAVGTAVRRNRIRRRLREIVRLYRAEIAPGWDVVIHPRGSVAAADFAALANELLRLLPRDKAAETFKE
ncbi:MAG TPA: ribonuclease P protein component [Candidatus Dormibacteraeota bacterium]|nr:ribonuclease P protein component [Candidatus Dormibacteraeota bacterium]